MLRVGLTGDLGSGKSTVAKMLAERGAIVLSSDEMARAMMQPGEAVYAAIVERFGSEVIAADGTLDRRRLAELAFDAASPRVEELNTIVHPAVLAAQAEAVAKFAETDKIVVIESALIFSAYGLNANDLKSRFDCVLLVVAPFEDKVARFVKRGSDGTGAPVAALEADARRRLAMQRSEEHAAECSVIRNDRGLAELESEVEAAWAQLLRLEAATDRRYPPLPPPPPIV